MAVFYHIVFTPKYRRKIIYNQYRSSLGEIFRHLCTYKGVEIIEGHLMPDHVHMLVSIPPRLSVSSVMGYLKGKSALMMFDKHANLSINLVIVISGQRASTIWGIVDECKLDLMKPQLRNIYKNKEIIQWMISSRA